MKPLRALVLLGALFTPCAASAGDRSQALGSGALTLAALIGGNSPLLGDKDKAALAKLLDGDTKFDFPKGQTITITANKVTCHASNIDIAEHDYTLAFGKKNVTLEGRAAHELYATLLEVGVQPNPGAGNIWVSVSKLDCPINVAEVQDKAGGGATCHSMHPMTSHAQVPRALGAYRWQMHPQEHRSGLLRARLLPQRQQMRARRLCRAQDEE